MVTPENVFVGTYQCETPFGTRHGTVAYVTIHTVNRSLHDTEITRSHLMSQCYQLGMFVGVGIGEYSLFVEPCSVGMDVILSVATYHHIICVWVGDGSTIDNSCYATHGQIAGDDACQLSAL